jgi:hypothetical protein
MKKSEKQFVDQVRKLATDNIDQGGDYIMECLSDEEIVERFSCLDAAKDCMEMWNEGADVDVFFQEFRYISPSTYSNQIN